VSRPRITAQRTGTCRACHGAVEIGDKLKLFEGAWLHTECVPKPEQKSADLPWLSLPNPWRSPQLAEILGYEIPEETA
jgi:hypothetical protein